MSNSNSGAKHSTDSAEAQTRRNWWHNAKDFIVSNCPMFDMGDNNKLNISENHINAGVVVVLERLISSVSHIDQGGAQESNEQSQHPETSAAQGNSGSGSGEPMVTVARQPTPVPTPPDPDNAFESEASSSKAYSYRAHTRSHVYSLEMMIHGAGYPLYMPTPSRGLSAGYRKKGVRVGDVGIITANGAFDFLFNACKHNDPSDAGVNPFILPDGFQLFNAVKRDRDEFDPGICLHSTHVSEIDDHDSSSAFQCSTKGAILALPTGATVYEARNIRQLGRQAARCAASWYEYALNEGGRDVSNGSLYFVTECTKSKNWGIAVFYGNAVANNDHRAIFDSETCQWKYRGKTDARVGPKPKDIVLLDDDEPNQCVFLRGFKIMLRPDIWDKLNAIDVTCQDGVSPPPPSTRTTTRSRTHKMESSQTYLLHQSPSSDSNTVALQPITTKVTEAFGNPHRPGSWLGQVILKEEFKETVPLHPSDPINVMLLHLKPEASVALVHDNVWCDQLPDVSTYRPA
ncbi:hypothetical protein F5887DRAFT_987264 [Amanita rubescens]|nr:hypothetical protein F5887DRAFT_987264 [Amanita rubescens]